MDIRNLDESLPHDMSGPVVIVLYQAGLLSPLVPTIAPRTAACRLTLDGNPNPTQTGSANCHTWPEVRVSRDLCKRLFVFGDFILSDNLR